MGKQYSSRVNQGAVQAMISFRRADLLDEFQPRLGLNLDVDIVSSVSNFSQTQLYWRVIEVQP